MSESQEKLARQWRAIHEGAGRAIAWIDAVRGNSRKLEDKADGLIYGLRRASNKARSLERAAGHPMAIGFFGLSQAGKSYLISTLAAGENGRLETEYGGQRVDFLTSVNPSGGGSEATGLVTRFTRVKPEIQDSGYPIEVRLFREIDLAKILANAWFKDFDQGKVEYKIDANRCKSMLDRFAGRAGGERQPGVDADDVVSLWDYVVESFGNHVQALEGDLQGGYWPQAAALAPYLSPGDRAEFFSILWGEERQLTQAYAQIAESLQEIGNAGVAHIPLEAVQDHSDGPPSIMNVTMLDQIGGDSAMIKIRGVKDGKLGEPVAIRRSHLAALTTELVFPLANSPREKCLETVDLLDFPGYRGRYDKARLSEIPNNPVGELLRRGKVAYLFELYTENQEMNGLVLCTPAHKQPETSAVVPVLDRWVRRTQGDTARDRAERSGLLWAVTMFNARVTDMLQKQDKWHQEWKGLNDIAFKIYESLEFMRDWRGGRPFSNTFMVRTPSYTDFTVKQGDKEVGVSPDKKEILGLMRASFVESDVLRGRFPQAGESWDAMMQLDDGGMGRLAGAISDISDIEFKLARLGMQLDETHRKIVDVGVGLFHREGSDAEGARQKKRALADKVAPVLRSIADNPKAYFILSELMHALELPSEALRNLYLSGADVQQAATAETGAQAASSASGDADDLFASLLGGGAEDSAQAGSTADAARVDTYEHWFADSAFKLWLNHLSEIPGRTRQHSMLKNIPQDILEIVVEELRNAAYRENALGLNLPAQMLQSLLSRTDSASKRDQMVMSQVLRVQMVLRDFIAWLGYLDMNEGAKPASASVANGKVFARTTALDSASGLPDLPEKNDMGKGREFLKDWVACLIDMIMKNAGFTAGQEISDDQNEALGVIIADIKKG